VIVGVVDELLWESIEPVLHDLRGAGISPPRFEDSDWIVSPNRVAAKLRSPDGDSTGVSVSRSDPVHERVAELADQVQEWAIEELWGRGSNWPQCPQHPSSHPMQATTRDGAAVWACPADRAVAVAIGTL
jgi:hypothetical protein